MHWKDSRQPRDHLVNNHDYNMAGELALVPRLGTPSPMTVRKDDDAFYAY